MFLTYSPCEFVLFKVIIIEHYSIEVANKIINNLYPEYLKILTIFLCRRKRDPVIILAPGAWFLRRHLLISL